MRLKKLSREPSLNSEDTFRARIGKHLKNSPNEISNTEVSFTIDNYSHKMNSEEKL
jgi:hypothetical protein